MSPLQTAVENGKALGKTVLYFGCWNGMGHFLHDVQGMTPYRELLRGLPWDEYLMDTGLLRNGKIPDVPDGKVYWTAGGNEAFWYAFYWWDRSVDTRCRCNSGFYVRGFGYPEAEAAFEYACQQFPHIVKRQKYVLVLQQKLGI